MKYRAVRPLVFKMGFTRTIICIPTFRFGVGAITGSLMKWNVGNLDDEMKLQRIGDKKMEYTKTRR
jgi:hypothetical protein